MTAPQAREGERDYPDWPKGMTPPAAMRFSDGLYAGVYLGMTLMAAITVLLLARE